MIYFSTRKIARTFAKKNSSYRVVDNGVESPKGQRWGVKVF